MKDTKVELSLQENKYIDTHMYAQSHTHMHAHAQTRATGICVISLQLIYRNRKPR